MRRVSTAMLVVGLVLAGSSAVRAQDRSFNVGSTYVGPVLGFGGLGGASIAFGGRIEHGFWSVPKLGDGVIGIEASFDYYHYNCGGLAGCGVSYIFPGVTGNYHFKIDNEKLDAFLGAGLGFESASCHYSGVSYCGGYSTNVHFIGRAGGRYNFTKNIGIYVDVGAGAATFDAGVMFAIGSKR